ncbi:MAG: helicase-related protein [Nitrososphaerota archaeon]
MDRNVLNIDNDSWNSSSQIGFNWIKIGDGKYQFLKEKLVDQIFPALQDSDKRLILYGLVKVINFIQRKFGFGEETKSNEDLWYQLTQNDLLDLRSLLYLILPFINDNETNDNKRRLRMLKDLYLEKDADGNFIYTNSQINRCVRHMIDGETLIFQRPYLPTYFIHNLELLLMSMEMVANKLYVNWIDIVPIGMDEYKNMPIYKHTVKKFSDISSENMRIPVINLYIDPNPGLSYHDIYNVTANHLYYEMKNHKWIIYDIVINMEPIPYIVYLEKRINLNNIWMEQLWGHIEKSSQEIFSLEWKNFLESSNEYDNIILNHLYFFFSKYHRNSQRLILSGKLILTRDIGDEEEEQEENFLITPQTTRNAKVGLANTPVEEIYLFFFDQLRAFKKTWYYYAIYVRKKIHLGRSGNIYVTMKNVYNYCKSMVHITKNNKYIPLPKHWMSINSDTLVILFIRIFDILHREYNDWTKPNWFNINNYLRKIYPAIPENKLLETNYLIHTMIRPIWVDIIFESLIIHGLLSDFRPSKMITDEKLAELNSGSSYEEKRKYQRSIMAKYHFSGKNRTTYGNESYYFVTGSTYGQLPPLGSKKYFDVLSTEYNWPFYYAMNWVTQINFYHHYINNRIIYITGATGVGKSTQIPKLIMYSQRMIDYNNHGRVICTQPRIESTVMNAETISFEMGVPIREYSKIYDTMVSTGNFFVQFKHHEEEHVDLGTKSYLRFVTDGVLSEEMIQNPFLTMKEKEENAYNSKGEKLDWLSVFTANNIYDVIIVDEAHEHNRNIDLILTLARESIYFNNSLKLVIISATIDDDEPIYRRFYRNINDNRAYPLSAYIEHNNLDRANVDRRMHIDIPTQTTRFPIVDHFLSKEESDLINKDNFVEKTIEKTINLVRSTTTGNILVFLTGRSEIEMAVREINSKTPADIICFGYYSDLTSKQKDFVRKIHENLPNYTRYKEDINLEEKEITRRVPMGTYRRAIIVATNIAEASITLPNLVYVVDSGYTKVNIYDPLEGISKMIVVPISRSSFIQRRGRVGRIAPGEVFHLYSKEKIEKNKVLYQIANTNITDLLVKLLKSVPEDSHIINPNNDINNIRNLKYIDGLKEYEPEDLVYIILENPQPFLEIIKRRYLHSPDLTDILQYYTYYGKHDFIDFDKRNFKMTLDQYFLENHDDYHYMEEVYEFYSRCYTGYSEQVLKDNFLSFYIIHPDENVVVRDPYTGNIVGIRNNNIVGDNYYYYLLKLNNLLDRSKRDLGNPNLPKIDPYNFILPKVSLILNDAKMNLLIIDVPMKDVDQTIVYKHLDDVRKLYIQSFYEKMAKLIGFRNTEYVKTQFFLNLDDIGSISKIDVFGVNPLVDIRNLMWYSFSIPYGLEYDVVALIILITMAPDLVIWIGRIRSRKDIEKFTITHLTKNGDIYFVWTIWQDIKRLIKSKIFDHLNVNIFSKNFYELRKSYMLKKKIPDVEFRIFEKIYRKGELESEHGLYYYLRNIQNKNVLIYVEDVMKKININVAKIVADIHNIDEHLLAMFLKEYMVSIIMLEKEKWVHAYEIRYGLGEKNRDYDILEYAKKKLSFPKIAHWGNEEWDLILETYLRAFSTNLIKYESSYYLRPFQGIMFDPQYWSKHLPIEKTFLSSKAEYFVYYNDIITNPESDTIFLTPVKLEWIFVLNPVYYFFLLFDVNNVLYEMKESKSLRRIVELLNQSRNSFNISTLIAYLDQLNNKQISSIVRDHLLSKNKLKN